MTQLEHMYIYFAHPSHQRLRGENTYTYYTFRRYNLNTYKIVDEKPKDFSLDNSDASIAKT